MTHPKRRQQQHQLSPFVLQQQKERAEKFQLHIADKITAFAGSMNFVYLHVFVFAVWMLFIEASPWPTLTLIVSLEAIFLSTFVMIGQNRQAAFQQAKADHDFEASEKELDSNTNITRAIHQLTTDIHERLVSSGVGKGPDNGAASAPAKPSKSQDTQPPKGA
jgi:uncharacterized membrane protein